MSEWLSLQQVPALPLAWKRALSRRGDPSDLLPTRRRNTLALRLARIRTLLLVPSDIPLAAGRLPCPALFIARRRGWRRAQSELLTFATAYGPEWYEVENGALVACGPGTRDGAACPAYPTRPVTLSVARALRVRALVATLPGFALAMVGCVALLLALVAPVTVPRAPAKPVARPPAVRGEADRPPLPLLEQLATSAALGERTIVVESVSRTGVQSQLSFEIDATPGEALELLARSSLSGRISVSPTEFGSRVRIERRRE